MGTGGKIPGPKTRPVYIVASESNSGCNLSFQDGDVFLDEAKAQAHCAQQNAAYGENSHFVETFYAIE